MCISLIFSMLLFRHPPSHRVYSHLFLLPLEREWHLISCLGYSPNPSFPCSEASEYNSRLENQLTLFWNPTYFGNSALISQKELEKALVERVY